MAFTKNDRIEDLITCKICHTWFDNPRMLSCLHTYCYKCIDKLASVSNEEFKCPLNDGFKISKNDINSLPVNQAIEDLTTLYGSIQSLNLCTNCKSIAAEYKCDTCSNVYFCGDCYRNVHTFPIMQMHKQVPVDEAISDTVLCEKHPKKQLEYWCYTCDKIICVECVLFNHKNHEYSSKDDTAKKIEHTIDSRLDLIQTCLEYRINQADLLINETTNHYQTSRLKITEAMILLREMINVHEKNMLEKLLNIEKEQKKQLQDFKNPLKNELQNLNIQKATFDILVATNNHTKILQMKTDLDNYLNKIRETLRTLSMPNKIEYYVEGLDQLQVLKQKIEHFGRYIEVPTYRNSELGQFISQNRKKQKFNLNNKSLNNADMKLLVAVFKENTTLTELSLEKNKIGQQGVQYIADVLRTNHTLTKLCLDQNQIGQQGAEHLADALKMNRTLTTLYLGENQIGSHGTRCIADALRTNRTITTLGLEQNEIGQQGAEYIAETLKVNETLHTLSLDQNEIGQYGAQHLADGLRLNKSLTVLYLNENQIEAKGAEYIANALKVNRKLTDLGLKQNELGHEGALHIAEALKTNKLLTDLGLQGNLIGHQGAQYIADALTINQTLTVLGLQQNQIGQQGASHIANALKTNRTLTALYLEENEIAQQGAQHLADALKINRTLIALHLGENHIGQQGAAHIADALKLNRTLTDIRLEKNEIGQEGVQRLQQCLKSNKLLAITW